MSLVVTDIQRFCVHDGPGIRTTVFLKGCTLKCPWCANPETIKKDIEYHVDLNKCKRFKKGRYCNHNCNVLLGQAPDIRDKEYCKANAIIQFGRIITGQELLKEIEKDAIYYESVGGITFSGGEPLIQLCKNVDLLKKLHDRFNICIETSLSTYGEGLSDIQQYIDEYIVDIKTTVKSDYDSLLKGNYNNYVNNLEILYKNNRIKDTTFRIPYVPNITDKKENITNINELIKSYGISNIQIFALHNLAESKYKSINMDFNANQVVGKETIMWFGNQLSCSNIEILEL